MNAIERRVTALEQSTVGKGRWLVATDKADAERQQAERDAGGETEPVQFIITGIPRNPNFGKW